MNYYVTFEAKLLYRAAVYVRFPQPFWPWTTLQIQQQIGLFRLKEAKDKIRLTIIFQF